MYCLLCCKHDTINTRNKSKVWNDQPSMRLRKVAITDHSTTEQHKNAVKAELLQRISCFHEQLTEKCETSETVIEKTFTAIYWLAKQEISNEKLLPLIDLIEYLGVKELKFFEYRSRPSIREMFLTIGQTIRELLSARLRKGNAYGILADEACDISVVEQLIVFVKYFDHCKGTAKTEFLGIKPLRDPQGVTAEAVTKKLVEVLEKCELSVENLKSFVSDRASVMTGKTNGVAARLKHLNKFIVNFHCICHKLALACGDSGDQINYIKDVETTLTSIWKFFQYSPKRTNIFVSIQMQLSKLNLSDQGKKALVTKIQKACRTRWLSLHQSVISVHKNFEALLQTFQFLEKDPLALGLYKKAKSPKFIGAVYMFTRVLPMLTELSKTFQSSTLNFGRVKPALDYTQTQLTSQKDSHQFLDDLERDLNEGRRLGRVGITLSDQDKRVILALNEKYISALKQNIEQRFDDCLNVFSCFHVFNPMDLPNRDSPEFKDYGIASMKVLANHYYQDSTCREQETDELLSEWNKFKFDMLKWKSEMPDTSDLQNTPLEWTLQRLLRMKTEFGYFFPKLVDFAEISMSAPVTNAWPERGASALKRLKTRFRSRLNSDLLNALMQITLNGPPVQSPKAEEVIQSSVKTWLSIKKRRKLPTHMSGQNQSQGASVSEQVQAVTMVDQEVQCTGNEELTTATEAEELQELHAATDAFSLDLVGDSDSDSGLDSEDEAEY